MFFDDYYKMYSCPRCGKIYCLSLWAAFSRYGDLCSCGFPVFQHGNSMEACDTMNKNFERRYGEWHLIIDCDCCGGRFQVASSELTFVVGSGKKSIWLFRCGQCSTNHTTIGKVVAVDFAQPLLPNGQIRYFNVFELDPSEYAGLPDKVMIKKIGWRTARFLGVNPSEVLEPFSSDEIFAQQRHEHARLSLVGPWPTTIPKFDEW